MNTKNIVTIPLLFFALFFLEGCINVEDFGVHWEQGTIDSALEGSWQNKDGECNQYVKERDHYAIKGEESILKTLTIEGSTFMLVKDRDEQFMFKYYVKEDELIHYSPNEDKEHEFKDHYKNQNIILDKHTVTITKLDDSVIGVLEEIGKQPEYWTASSTYRKHTNSCEK